jgi:tagatose 6-phosphate kinase
MVISAGLSPAWQHVIAVQGFEVGAVNRASEVHWCASGKVLNVAVALHHLSAGKPEQTLALSPLGGAAYDAIEDEFKRLGVPRRWLRTRSATRTCTTVVDLSNSSATELVENASPLTAAELEEFQLTFIDAAANSDAVVLTGSLPRGAPTSIFRDILAHAKCPAVLDARGPELLEALAARPQLVKPNREELSLTLGRPLQDDDDLRSAIKELQRRGAQSVLITSGSGPVWLGHQGRFHHFVPEPVSDIVNPIGCGDCLAAGVAWTLAQGGDVVAAVETGMALAAKNLRTLLPCDFDGRRANR